MATTKQASRVKCLNKSPGAHGKRFTFKTFRERVEDIDIDVFRSLLPVKPEPSEGSSFFRDALLYWRELNTAEGFISFYEEVMPIVQTLPQILLHKERIFMGLIERVRMEFRLSLEPILGLFAALSRDLLEEFIPLLPKLVSSLYYLLQSGGEHDPDVLEQVFTSLSYLIMHLQKYLINDLVQILKTTIYLRCYPKDYIQEFMAEAVSFLIRNAPMNQLHKGIRRILVEAMRNPTAIHKNGAIALLWHTIRGTSSRLHSKAEEVIGLLINSSILNKEENECAGSDNVVMVICGVLQRLCQELGDSELNLIWSILFDSIRRSCSSRSWLHTSYLLSILVSMLHQKRNPITGFHAVVDVATLLIENFLEASKDSGSEKHLQRLLDTTLQLLLCLLDMPCIQNNISELSCWAPVFKLVNSSLVTFLKQLLKKEIHVVCAFKLHIISAIDNLVDSCPEEALYLLLTFCGRVDAEQSSEFVNGSQELMFSRLMIFFKDKLHYWCNLVNCISTEREASLVNVLYPELVVLWGVLSCYHRFGGKNEISVVKDVVHSLSKVIGVKTGTIAGISQSTWQGLLGAALSLYHKLISNSEGMISESEVNNFLQMAMTNKSSRQILVSVADFLDSALGSYKVTSGKKGFIAFDANQAADAISIFSQNLAFSDKAIRLATLRILSHYDYLDEQSLGEECRQKKSRVDTTEISICPEELQHSHVIHLLLCIESTPISVSTSRAIIISISRIESALNAKKISEAYIAPLLYGLIGILHIRFSRLWEPTIECLKIVIVKYKDFAWDRFVQYLGNYQSQFLCGERNPDLTDSIVSDQNDLGICFSSFLTSDSDCTPSASVLSLLLQTLQKVLDVAEACSRKLVPLFLNFLGYFEDNSRSVEVFSTPQCSKKEWKMVMLDWLNLFVLMRNPSSLYQNKFVKEVFSTRLLGDADATIQLKVLDCLLNWRDEYLLLYERHLRNILNQKNLREELTTWSLSKDSLCIQESHRASLIPLVIRMLVPKVTNSKTLASRKRAGLNHRKTVLCFLAQLDMDELGFFFYLLLKHLYSSCSGLDDPGSLVVGLHGNFQSVLVKCFTSMKVDGLSLKRAVGFLHVLDDILRTFDEMHLIPYLNPLISIVAQILERCSLNLYDVDYDDACGHGDDLGTQSGEHGPPIADSLISTSDKQSKDVRSLCLNVISFVLDKYHDHDLGVLFWDVFFTSIKPLITTFKQENASCLKPSSLLRCFLAMSRSPILFSLMNRNVDILPSIFSILTVSRTSDAVVSSVLTFIENILNLDVEMDREDTNSVKSILLPQIETIVSCLRELFRGHKKSKRETMSVPGKTEIGMLRLLVRYVDKPLTAHHFLDIMLPFFKKKLLTPNECIDGLHVIKEIIPVMDRTSIAEVFCIIQSLLLSAELSIRLHICDILDLLSETESSVLFLAKLLRDLHAISSSGLDELDYDTRVIAYDKIKPELFLHLPKDHAIVILSHCVHDMSSEDLIFRQSASSSLLSFIKFAAFYLNPEKINGPVLELTISEGMYKAGNWTKLSIVKVIRKIFLHNIGHAMGKEIYIQREWLSVLREMTLRLPGISVLNSLRPLCHEDLEADFFNNIFHLQTHKRGKAISQFKKVISDVNVPEELSEKIFVPMFFNMIFDVKDGKGEHLRNGYMEIVACLCGQMQWGMYYRFLMRCLREVSLKADRQKYLLKLICLVLDKFHFSNVNSNYSQDRDEDANADIDTSEREKQSSRSCKNDCNKHSSPPEVEEALLKVVLPRILNLLDPGSDRINVSINLAALKLLKHLSGDSMDLHLSSILHHIANFLKSRMESVRDEARSALVVCMKELSLAYLQFALKVIKSILKRGYELHVLGYTLNYILSKCLVCPVVGCLDYCLEDLFLIVENDILGDVAEEKEVEKIASKMKETRNRMSFDTLKLIAQNISFKTHAMNLLSLVNANLQKHLTSKTKVKAVNMFHHIALGIKSNPSAEEKDVLIFVYGLLEDNGLVYDTSGGKLKININEEISCKMDNSLTDQEENVLVGSQGSHLIIVFGLEVLNNCLKKMKLSKDDENLLSMLDPFVKLLVRCLTSKFEDVLSAAFKCLIPISRLPLPSLSLYADKIKVLLMDILQKSPNANSPLVRSCVKLLTVLLTRISLSNDQLCVLIQFPLFIDLQTNPSPMALSLLKQIVARKLEVPELYDIVSNIAELMITSQSEPIRRKCNSILLKFLLDYPLSEKCRLQHLNFLLTNLSYEHASGREAVLEMLNIILSKFPKRVVESHSISFFIHLVLALANEKDYKIQSMILAVTKHLMKCSSQDSLKKFLDYSLSWYTCKNQHLWGASAQAIGLLVEMFKNGLQGQAHCILQVVKDILESSKVSTSKNINMAGEIEISLWEQAYYSLKLFEKMLLQFPEFYIDESLEDLWDVICTFLLHPHLKLREVSSHLVAMYFTAASVDNEKMGTKRSSIQDLFLLDPARLFKLAVSFCIQLMSKSIDDTSSNLISQNVVYATCKLHSYAKLQNNEPPHKFWSTLTRQEKNCYLEAFDLLGSNKVKNSFLLFSPEESDICSENHYDLQDFQSLLVASLLKKMGKIAALKEDNQVKVVFNCLRMITAQIGLEGCRGYATYILEPIYKVCEGFSGRIVSDEVKQLAEEVRNSVKNLLGADYFVQVYNTVRKKLKEKRDKRKQEEKLMAITDPARTAKRKLLKSAKHRAHKRRKIMGLKMERWRR